MRKLFRYSKDANVMTARAKPPAPPAASKKATDQYFAAQGATLRYRDEGHGPAVMLIHGWTLDLEMWDPQIAALRDSFRTVRLDRRGFGLSSGRPGHDEDIADVGSLCEHLAIRRVSLVGMSQGARAALGFALLAPGMISCLILDGPPDCGRSGSASDDDVPFDHYRALIRTDGIGAFRREWSAHPLVSLRTGDARMRQILSSMIMRYPGNDLQSPATSGAPARSLPIASIGAPALVITGDHDQPSRIQAANTLARQLAGAERAVIRSAGHLPNLDNSKDYNSFVRRFLKRHATSLP
jgi:3-oxoadipate enol-lactonase